MILTIMRFGCGYAAIGRSALKMKLVSGLHAPWERRNFAFHTFSESGLFTFPVFLSTMGVDALTLPIVAYPCLLV